MSGLAAAFAFTDEQRGPIRAWTCDPDCDTAHAALLAKLDSIIAGNFLSDGTPLNERRKGNLGEFICWCIGSSGMMKEYKTFSANALKPLSNISTDGIDIVWVFLSDDAADADHAVLCETKTTTSTSTAYARTMTADFKKLFGDDPAFTLQSRFQAIKNEIEFGHQRPDLCPRIEALAGWTPRECSSITLVPAVLHDANSNSPDSDLLAVRTSVASDGWSDSKITPWAVSLHNLEDRLTRLSCGQS